MEEPKIALFICTCDHHIGTNIDLDRLESEVSTLQNVVTTKHIDSLCTKAGQEVMKEELKNSKANRVVVAGCTPRTYEEIIRKGATDSGINRNLYEQTGIREQCEWIHTDKESCTDKAIRLVKSAIAKVTFSQKILDEALEIKSKAVLIIGGGVAGIQASLLLATKGINSYIIERTSELGGLAVKLSPGALEEIGAELPNLEDVLNNEKINVVFNSEVKDIKGGLGNYQVIIQSNKNENNTTDSDQDPTEEQLLEVGGIIVATGSKLFDSNRIPELHFEYDDVITSLDLEKMLAAGEIKLPSNNSVPKRINFLQCIGSRDENRGNPHCSLVCCTYAIRQAMAIKALHPEVQVSIHYMDLRGPYPGFEESYSEALEKGIQFIRGRAAEIQKVDGKLILRAENIDLGETFDWDTDLIVLSVGQEPSEGNDRLSELLHVPLDVDGFLGEYNYRWDILDRRGISIAGAAQGPRNIKHALRDANRAAAEIAQVLNNGTKLKQVHSIIDPTRCAGCGICESLCPYDAISMKNVEDFEAEEIRQISNVNISLCQACGACAMACPSNVPILSSCTADQLIAEIEAVT